MKYVDDEKVLGILFPKQKSSVAKESLSNAEVIVEEVKIPEPFDKYYDVIAPAELIKYHGYKDEQDVKDSGADGKYVFYGVEDNPYYKAKHIAWLLAKPEYRETLNPYDSVELAKEGEDIFLADIVADRIYNVNDEIKEKLGISEDATEQAEGNMDEANRLRAEADRLEKLEDNSGGRVDYSDEINELEEKAAKENDVSAEALTEKQTAIITEDAEKLFKKYLAENDLTEDDVIGRDFMKILDYIMKNSAKSLVDNANEPAKECGGLDKTFAKESFAKFHRPFNK